MPPPVATPLILTLFSSAAMATYTPPKVALPTVFRNAPASVDATVAVANRWWTAFGDPKLDRMVESALANNLDIEMAAARLEAAAAGVKSAHGARLPSFSIDGSAGIQQLSVEDQQGKLTSRIPGFQRTVERYGLNGAASWEIDLFGRLSAAERGARARRDAAAIDIAGVRLTIAAEVSDTYITVRTLQARLKVAQERVATLADLDRMVGLRVARGIAAPVEADRAKAELAIASAAVPELEAGLEVSFNRLDVLLGRPPGSAKAELGAGDVPQTPKLRVVDGPAALLARRPDVVAAERLVASNDAAVAQAIAAKYPQLTISGFAGFLANGLTNLFTAGAVQLGTGAQVTAPIFAGGRLRAQEQAAKAGLRESVANYRQTALQAAADAENALSALSRKGQQAATLDQAEQVLVSAEGRIHAAYRAGSVSLIDEIVIRRQRQDAQEQALIARADASKAAVASCRALGGGWKN